MRTNVVLEPCRLTPQQLAAGRSVRQGATWLAARSRSERPGDLTATMVAVLGQLARHGSMTPRELADRLRMVPQSLTRTLSTAQDSGWTHRVPDPTDGRQSLLTISEAGRAVLDADMRPRDTWVAAAMAAELTPEEADLLVVAARLMQRLADVDAAPGPSGP